MAKLHIGKKIRKVQKSSGIGVTELGLEIGVTRNVVYDIFDRESINTELLLKISRVLDHNFFRYYSDEFKK